MNMKTRIVTTAIAVLTAIGLPAWAVMEDDIGLTLPADTPQGLKLVGEVSSNFTVWHPNPADQSASGTWQSFRYSESGSIALAVGNPVNLLKHPANRDELKEAVVAFINSHIDDFNLSGCSFHVESIKRVKNISIVYLKPEIDGIGIYGSYVVASVNSSGGLAMIKARGFGSNTYRTTVISETQAVAGARRAVGVIDGEYESRYVLLPVADANSEAVLKPAFEISLFPENPEFRPVLFIDAVTGLVIAAENRVYYDEIEGSTSGLYKPQYRADDSVEDVFPYEWLRMGQQNSVSDEDGFFFFQASENDLPLAFRTELKGSWVDVDYEDGVDASLRLDIENFDDIQIAWDEETARMDEMNLFYHVNLIHDFWKTLDEDLDEMDFPMQAMCMFGDGYDNAFSNGRGIYFGDGAAMDNFALYSDIIYHEYTHSVTGVIYPRDMLPYEGESGALNEAWSDYFPCSISDEPYMGEGGLRPNGYIRLIDNDLVYPDDIVGEVHYDSRIISAAMWHTRGELGRDITDPLFHFSKYEFGTDFLTYFADIMLTDDDDGNVANGTPHDNILYENFGRHGIGPGLVPVVSVSRIEFTDDNINGAEGNENNYWEPGETVRIELEVFRGGSLFPPPAENVILSVTSVHPSLEIENGEIEFGDMRVGDRFINAEPVLLHISEDAEVSFASLYLTISANGYEPLESDTTRITIGIPRIMLVRDDNGTTDRSEYYTSALDKSGQVYSSFNTSSEIIPLVNRLEGVESVIWFTGDADQGVLSVESQFELSEYLNNGGNLLLTGQGIGNDPATEEFLVDYMGAVQYDDSVHQVWIEGVDDDPVAQGMNMVLLGADGAQNQLKPGTLEAFSDAIEIFHWARLDPVRAAGVRREDSYTGAKTVYLSFGLEGAGGNGGTATAGDVIESALRWFDSETGVEIEPEHSVPVRFTLESPYPNPFNGSLTIPFILEKQGRVNLRVYDISGREIFRNMQMFDEGKSIWSLKGVEWSTGVYFIELSNESHATESSRIILLK